MYLAIQQHCSISGPQTIVDVALISHTAPSFCLQSPTKFLQASSGDKNVKRPAGGLGGAAIAQQKMATRTSPQQHTTTCKGLQPKCFSTSASMMVSEASAPVLQHVLTAQKRIVLQHVNPTNTTKCYSTWCLVSALELGMLQHTQHCSYVSTTYKGPHRFEHQCTNLSHCAVECCIPAANQACNKP